MMEALLNSPGEGKSDDGRKSYIPWGQNYENEKKQFIESRKMEEERKKIEEGKLMNKKVAEENKMKEQKRLEE